MREAVARVRPRDRFRRRNAAYVRQGEWFFLPSWNLRVDERDVLVEAPSGARSGDVVARLAGSVGLGGIGDDPILRQVYDGKPVAAGERVRDAAGGGDAFVDERLGERAGAGSAAGRLQLVRGEELRRREQVEDQLCELVDA